MHALQPAGFTAVVCAGNEYGFLSGDGSLVDDRAVLACLLNEERNGVSRAVSTRLGFAFTYVQVLQTLHPNINVKLDKASYYHHMLQVAVFDFNHVYSNGLVIQAAAVVGIKNNLPPYPTDCLQQSEITIISNHTFVFD